MALCTTTILPALASLRASFYGVMWKIVTQTFFYPSVRVIMAKIRVAQLSHEIYSRGEQEIRISLFYRKPLTGAKDSDNGLEIIPWSKWFR